MRLLVVLAIVACHQPVPPNAPVRLAFGPLTLELFVGERATEFHAVDQMSAWYPYHHVAYSVLATAPDAPALAEQRTIRSTHPWGHGLEAAYYLGRTEAIDPETHAREGRVLAALAPRIAPLLARTQPHVLHFAAAIGTSLDRAEPVLRAAARLFATPPRTLSIVLVARPGGGVGGGGANGGVLVIEVTDDEQSVTPLVHESVHALIESRRPELERAVASCGDGLDPTTLEEGIVHAIAPGLIHDGSGDPLAEHAHDVGPTGRFYALGVAVRPAVQRALADGDFGALLDAACIAWRARVSTST